MPKRKTLADLNIRGTSAEIQDLTTGETVEVWIQKMSPVEHEKSLRKGSAARARLMMAAKDRDSDEYLAAYTDLADFTDREGLVDLAYRDELIAKRIAVEAEEEAEDEWSEDGYFQGLFDAWEGDKDNEGLKAAYARGDGDDRHEEYDEAARVFGEIKRFNDIVERKFAAERTAIIRDTADVDNEELIHKAVGKFLEQRLADTFIGEYHDWELFHSCRQPDNHRNYYFATRGDIDDLPDETKAQLTAHVAMITVEPTEGKGLAATPPSSPSAVVSSTEPDPSPEPSEELSETETPVAAE